MIEKSLLYTSLVELCEKYTVTKKTYQKGDIVLDHESNHLLYLFVEGWYTAWSESPFGSLHEVGEIEAPSTLGEGIFFGSYKKPIKVIAESSGYAYLLSEEIIDSITQENPNFRETLMRACLATSNERIREANIERTIDYTLTDALEADETKSIPKMLETLRKIFSLPELIWIERHEILEDVYSIRYRTQSGSLPVHEKIDMKKYEGVAYIYESSFLDIKHAHIFPLTSRGENYGFLIYASKNPRLAGYIHRITLDIIPHCIRIIEENWKK